MKSKTKTKRYKPNRPDVSEFADKLCKFVTKESVKRKLTVFEVSGVISLLFSDIQIRSYFDE